MTKNNPIVRKTIVLLVACLILCLAGCFPGKKEEITRFNALKKLRVRSYPLFTDAFDFEDVETALDYSLAYFKKVPLDRKYYFGREIFSAAHMIRSLETLKLFLASNPSLKALNRFIKDRYIVYEARGNSEGKVLFTGYFEPTYEGDLVRSDAYAFPLYSIPEDLMTINLSDFSPDYKDHPRLKARVDEMSRRIMPYYSREQINSIDAFHQRAQPVCWLKSRVDRFFLEIQGSGRIRLPSGGQMRVHYASSNGNAYRSVGRYLIRKGEILKENMSMQAIRKWLEENPERMDEVLNHNQSFVFFKQESDGPLGSLGVKVTPRRSIATDARLFPKGALCFIQTRLPGPDASAALDQWPERALFVMNQDTGGAIKGGARADLFCGNGEWAEFTAGHKNVYGQMFFLVLSLDQ